MATQKENDVEAVFKAYDDFETEKLMELTALYAETDNKLESDLMQLQEKMTLYGNIFEIMGDLEAEATGMEKLAYAYRHEATANTFMKRKADDQGNKLTGEERKAVAEIAVRSFRRKEAKYAGASKKWRNRRESVLEQINIMKRRQDLFTDEWNKANFINGYN